MLRFHKLIALFNATEPVCFRAKTENKGHVKVLCGFIKSSLHTPDKSFFYTESGYHYEEDVI